MKSIPPIKSLSKVSHRDANQCFPLTQLFSSMHDEPMLPEGLLLPLLS